MASLDERMGYLQALRLTLGVVVLASSLFASTIVGSLGGGLLLATIAYFVLSALEEALQRVLRRRGLPVVALMLLIDGVFIAWVALLTGGAQSPLRFLVYLHLIGVTLLASYRTGLKIALWHSLLFFAAYYVQAAEILDFPLSRVLGDDARQLYVFNILAFWLVAIFTAVFSSINERELRRRKTDLEALAAMGSQLEDAAMPSGVGQTLLDKVCNTFDFERGIVLAAADGDLKLLAGRGVEGRIAVPPGCDSLIRRAWQERQSLLIKYCDPNDDPQIHALLPSARNILVAPLFAEGHPLGALVVEQTQRVFPRLERRIVAMIEQFASHAALALRNAWLLEQIKLMAATDPLTDVGNRRTFEGALESEVARSRRTGEQLSLVMIDIDHFKSFNDAHGHQAGDDALRRAAGALRLASREFDTVARYGGEEFAVILPTCSQKQSLEAAERLRRALSVAGTGVAITASAGVATFPVHADSTGALVKAADEALYASKRRGRDCLTEAGSSLAPQSSAAPGGAKTTGEILEEARRKLASRRERSDVYDAAVAGAHALLAQSASTVVIVEKSGATLAIKASNVDALAEGDLQIQFQDVPPLVRTMLERNLLGEAKVNLTEMRSLGIQGDGMADVLVLPLSDMEGLLAWLLVVVDYVLDKDLQIALASLARDTSIAVERCDHARLLREWTRRFSVVEEQLTHRALYDPLTNLANRELFTQQVEQGLRRRNLTAQPLAVLVADLDDFKTINDSVGRAGGDRLLGEVADRLRGCLRPGDFLARLDGNAFAVLIEDEVNKGNSPRIAERILDALKTPFALDGKGLLLKASMGIAFSDSRGEEAQDLIRNADMAMHAAKGKGHSRYEIFEATMRSKLLDRFELKSDLQQAVPKNQLRLHYQPVVNLRSGSVSGVEALVRWNHPSRGVLSPAHFISVAEETGMILPIGRWVLREACQQTRMWDESFDTESLTVSVNLSAKQLAHPSLVEDVEAALREAELSPECLVLEITESVLMADSETTSRRLKGLKQLGVRLAIDDFGTGYSSLSYLRRFDLDILKIDRFFVDGISVASEETALVRAIVDLGNSLKMDVVAEGIEFGQQLVELLGMNCAYGQGHLFAKAMNASEAESWLSCALGVHASADELEASFASRIMEERPKLSLPSPSS